MITFWTLVTLLAPLVVGPLLVFTARWLIARGDGTTRRPITFAELAPPTALDRAAAKRSSRAA